MNEPSAAAAPETGTPDIPTFEQLAADPEIAALLDFTPVPRQSVKVGGWAPVMQRMFIAWLAHYGSPTRACDELGKARSGIDKLYKAADADEFRASWDAAVALNERRRIGRLVSRHGGAGSLRAPTPSRARLAAPLQLLPGQVFNEHGEPEDAGSMARRADEARDRIRNKLLGCRRAYLAQIAPDPGKRAAFEILTELPIDWEKAEQLEPQADEPWNIANQRQPDMVLTAESGWTAGEWGYGPDRKAQAREVINELRAERGQEPIAWDSESAEGSEQARSAT